MVKFRLLRLKTIFLKDGHDIGPKWTALGGQLTESFLQHLRLGIGDSLLYLLPIWEIPQQVIDDIGQSIPLQAKQVQDIVATFRHHRNLCKTYTPSVYRDKETTVSPLQQEAAGIHVAVLDLKNHKCKLIE